MPAAPPLIIRNLGLVEYEDGVRLQEHVAEQVHLGKAPDHLFLLQHPHVLTTGRRGNWENLVANQDLLASRGVELHATDRGGDITYHGPGQLVGYPIIQLPEGRRDVRRYVQNVEDLLIRTCAAFGVEVAPGGPGRTGVWAGNAKLGAIGVRIDKWITRHGFALNVATDLSYFSLIVPCGLTGSSVSSLRVLAPPQHQPVKLDAVLELLAQNASEVFQREATLLPIERDSVQVLVWRPRQGGHGPEFLVLERTPERGGFEQPVTGIIEAGESPLQAACRELREETGLVTEAERLHDLSYVHSFLIEAWVRPENDEQLAFCREHSFSFQIPDGQDITISPREHAGFRWLPAEDALAAMRWKGNQRGIRLVQRLSEDRC